MQQDPALLLGQGLELVGLLDAVADALEHPLGDGRVQHGLPGRDAAHGVDQVGAPDLLEHVARRRPAMIAANSASSSSYEVRIRPWIDRVDRADVAAHVDAVAVGQPRVEDRDVGAQSRDAAGRLEGRGRLADHLDVAVVLEQVA